MLRLKVAAAALNQTPLDWKGNVQNIIEVLEEAEHAGVDILCLPELCITGYGCEDHFHSTDVQQRAFQALQEIAKHVGNMVACVGLPFVYRNALYNVTAVLFQGELLGLVAKQHLAGDGIHYEPRWFKPWPARHRARVHGEWGDSLIGDLQFDVGGIRIGFEICEDAWVAERPGAHLARSGVDIILNPSASHFAIGKHKIRERLVVEGSRAFSATYVYANLLGNESGRAIYDGHCLIATGGTLVACSDRFSMEHHYLVSAIVDVEDTRTSQVRTSSYSPEFESDHFVEVSTKLTPSSEPATPAVSSRDPSPFTEFEQAQSLALYDYMRKSRSKGFVISLSGGADSAACAILVTIMVMNGIDQLGPVAFLRSLDLPPEFALGAPPEDAFPSENTSLKLIMDLILTCVYQSTRNSSETTYEAAKAVAENLGAKFLNIDVDAIVEAYTKMVGDALGHEFNWKEDDLVLQNIQARARAPGVWMVANLEHKLLITTSNRSEAAVGYCTMDGDTAGSIAPLAGIDKDFVLRWLRSLSLSVFNTFPSLEKIVKQQPTAELRPGSTQTDETDLMPYAVLEFIEDQAILKKRGPRDVHRLVMEAYQEPLKLTSHTAFEYVERFFTLWCRNQWKRERYALSFHLDDKNLDPRSWCRFPVLSGGFMEELAELRSLIYDGIILRQWGAG